ncbi:MAG: PIN domain-containing protein [Deltaproteobacteria bacterium]|nr:PIN domain-containing protein [Deltaproteobacteria bacterium]
MIALDTNILIPLLVRSQPDHTQTKQWILAVSEPLATTPTNLAESLRLLTHPRVFPSPLSLAKAIDLVQEFVEQFDIKILEEPDDWWLQLKELLKSIPSLSGNEVFDARIALCLRSHGVREICTLDADFAKYPFLKIIKVESEQGR